MLCAMRSASFGGRLPWSLPASCLEASVAREGPSDGGLAGLKQSTRYRRHTPISAIRHIVHPSQGGSLPSLSETSAVVPMHVVHRCISYIAARSSPHYQTTDKTKCHVVNSAAKTPMRHKVSNSSKLSRDLRVAESAQGVHPLSSLLRAFVQLQPSTFLDKTVSRSSTAPQRTRPPTRERRPHTGRRFTAHQRTDLAFRNLDRNSTPHLQTFTGHDS